MAGFTLLELLVVVLIIGILAAVSWPYYQTALDKSRLAPYVALGKSIRDAQEVYYMSNGKYAFDLSELDIAWPKSCNTNNSNMVSCGEGVLFNNHSGGNSTGYGLLFVILCQNGGKQNWSTCSQYNGIATVSIYYANAPTSNAGKIICSASNTNARGKRLCASSLF